MIGLERWGGVKRKGSERNQKYDSKAFLFLGRRGGVCCFSFFSLGVGESVSQQLTGSTAPRAHISRTPSRGRRCSKAWKTCAS